MVVNSTVPILRKKLTHRQAKEVGDRDLDIKWEIGHGAEPRVTSGAAGKSVFFFYKAGGSAVDYERS